MIKIIPRDERYFTDHGWLKSYWLFSFSDYYDPGNVHHGSLRVFNDDYVDPHSGFATHPHREMEIVTIVLEGAITHKDSMGNEAVIRAGEVQSMSAGTGITHSEHNRENEVLHLYQIWIFPEKQGLRPSYDQKAFNPSLWKNRLFPVASGQGMKEAVKINADATIYRCVLERDNILEQDISENRHIFMYITEGEIEVNGHIAKENDQIRMSGETGLKIKSHREADFILIDVS